MAENAILIEFAPAGPYEDEGVAAGEIKPGEVLELTWNSGAGQWEVQPNEAAVPGLRVAKGGFEEGLDQVYAGGDGVRLIQVHSGEVVQAYVYGEADGAAATIAKGEVLYKTAAADHTTGHEGALDANVNGVAVARAKEDVGSGDSELIKVEKL